MELKEIERSIITTYRKKIWVPFIKGINDYKLINGNDKVAVCISGGKDSFLLAKCMQEIKKHGKINFDLEFIVMNPGYNQENLELIKENAKKLDIPINIFDSNIFNTVDTIRDKTFISLRLWVGNKNTDYILNYINNRSDKFGQNISYNRWKFNNK